MPNHVLQLDCATGSGDVEVDFGSLVADLWIEFDIAFNATYISTIASQQAIWLGHALNGFVTISGGVLKWRCGGAAPFTPATPITALQFYHVKLHLAGAPSGPALSDMWVDGTLIGTDNAAVYTGTRFFDLSVGGSMPGALQYYDNFQAGTTEGGIDLGTDDFEGGSLAFWNAGVADAAIIVDPGIAPPSGGPGPLVGRVLIAFDDGPLVAAPTWTPIDQGGAFPDSFVSGYDLTSGRQTLLAQTDTGTATVYINDHEDGLFDPRNASSPYFGKLAGKQILLQLYEPVGATWEPQFQGWIKRGSYDIDGSAVDANGDPINASIQLECVDVFDKVGGYGLTPGLDGVFPLGTPGGAPAGAEDGVWYAETTGTVDDRIIEILTDVGIDSTRYIVASGNVRLKAVKYDPGESALVALRDAVDAELPFIANVYVNRHGQFVFRGRYSRFYPDDVAAEPGSDWDFTRWSVGDGKAILADPTRAQMRVLSYAVDDDELINVAGAWPQDIAAVNMPGQWYADTTSITDYGQHAAPPMSDLLTLNGATTGNTGNVETSLYGELLVKNKKDPREAITSLQVKTLRPDDPRAAATWPLIAKADISHIINVAVGYPSGTGFTGTSPADDHYIEGRQMRVRPLAGDAYDYVEVDYETSPAIWSMDTQLVFPNPFA